MFPLGCTCNLFHVPHNNTLVMQACMHWRGSLCMAQTTNHTWVQGSQLASSSSRSFHPRTAEITSHSIPKVVSHEGLAAYLTLS